MIIIAEPGRKSRYLPGNRAGAAVVELAVLMPLLVLLVIGIWEIGRLIQLQQIMNTAARDGARVASQPFILMPNGTNVQVGASTGSPNVLTTVTQSLQAAGITNLNGLQVSFQFIDGNTTLTDPYQGVKNQHYIVSVTPPV